MPNYVTPTKAMFEKSLALGCPDPNLSVKDSVSGELTVLGVGKTTVAVRCKTGNYDEVRVYSHSGKSTQQGENDLQYKQPDDIRYLIRYRDGSVSSWSLEDCLKYAKSNNTRLARETDKYESAAVFAANFTKGTIKQVPLDKDC